MNRQEARDIARKLYAERPVRLWINTLAPGPQGRLVYGGCSDAPGSTWAVFAGVAAARVVEPSPYLGERPQLADNAIGHAGQNICLRCDTLDPEASAAEECFCIEHCGLVSCGGVLHEEWS